MLIIKDQLVSEAILENQFVCNLNKCKGACCVLGDQGAPLKPDEISILESEYNNYKDYLTKEGIEEIEQNGFFVKDEKEKTLHTPLIDKKACVFINYDAKNIAYCGIEKAYLEGKTTFKKPISCHLYPIRVSSLGALHALNYDEWDVCEPACQLGKELQIPVYKFLKEPIERAFGSEFYELLDAYAQQQSKN